MENLSKAEKFLIETLIEQMKTVAMGHKRGWVWMSRKNIIRRFFGNFGLSKFWCSEHNKKILPQYPSKSVSFSIDFMREELEHVVAEDFYFEYWAK